MKKAFIILFVAALMGCGATAQVQWSSMEDASQVELKSNNKLFFVDFSTSWCGWCKRMDRETFTDPVVAAILNRYYIPVSFDAEGNSVFTWNGNKYMGGGKSPNGRNMPHTFTQAILGKNIGYPSFAIFNKNRGLIQILQGYQTAYDFQMVLWYFANGDNTRYTFDEYQAIFNEEIKPDMMKNLGLDR